MGWQQCMCNLYCRGGNGSSEFILSETKGSPQASLRCLYLLLNTIPQAEGLLLKNFILHK